MHKKAFTITELFIVCAIILSIILCVPFIKKGHTKYELYKQFRNTFVTLSTALNISVIENGDIDTWDFFDGDAEKIILTYFKPYLNNSIQIGCSSFDEKSVKDLIGRDISKGCDIYGVSATIPKGILRIDTATMGLYNIDTEKKQITITLDINGYDLPNVLGRDIYRLTINNSVYEPSVKAGLLNQNCSLDLLSQTGILQGLGCADRLMNEGMMDY